MRAMLAQCGRGEVEVIAPGRHEISLRFRIGETVRRAFQPTFDSVFFQTSPASARAA